MASSTGGTHLFILIRDQARPNQELLVAPVADPTATKVRGSCCEHEQPCHPDIKARATACPARLQHRLGLCFYTE